MTTLAEQKDAVGVRVPFIMLDYSSFTMVALPPEDLKRDDDGNVLLDAEDLPMADPRKDIIREYIAGPMTGYEYWNFPAFDDARNRRLALGHQVISPADLDRARGIEENLRPEDFPTDAFRTAMRIDMFANLMCTNIFMLRGWQNSKGARNELAWAQALGLVITFDDDAVMGRINLVPELGVAA